MTANYLDKFNILYKYQSGFRPNHSTNSCLSFLSNKVLTGIEKGNLWWPIRLITVYFYYYNLVLLI